MTDIETRIRPATRADFDQVARVFAEENRFHAALVPDDIQVAEPILTPAWFEELLADPNRALLVAEIDGEVAGVALLQETSGREDPIVRPRRYLTIEEIAVAEDYRGQGIGRQLMERAAAWAVERGLGTIELDVWEANRAAIRFYERLGYKPIRRRMRRDLGPSPATPEPVSGDQ
jgi:ribosomal protein S18 acetylase RimI-like enzyme